MVPLKAKNAQSRICTCWWLTSDEDRYRDEGGAGTGSDWITELQMNTTLKTPTSNNLVNRFKPCHSAGACS